MGDENMATSEVQQTFGDKMQAKKLEYLDESD